MESLFIRKIIYVCESLLFRNTKITLPNFLKKCKKQNVKIICAVAKRLVAFLKSLPKNLALFQALEPAIGYILEEQLTISKEHQEFILRTEKLEFNKHITSYELAGAVYLLHDYKYLFTKSFADMIKRKEINDSQFVWFFGQMWLKYGDKKNFTYDLNVDINRHYESIGGYVYFERENIVSPRTFNTFSDMVLHLLSLEIYKVYNFEIYCE